MLMEDFFNEFIAPAGAEVSVIPVTSPDGQGRDVDDAELPETLPILALRNTVLFPGTIYPVNIGREKSLKLIQDAEKNDSFIGAVPQMDVAVEEPKASDLFGYGTAAKVVRTLEMPDGTVTAILQGFRRFALGEIIAYEPYMLGKVRYAAESKPTANAKMLKIKADLIKEKAIYITKFSSFVPKEAVSALKSIDNFEFLVNFVSTSVDFANSTSSRGSITSTASSAPSRRSWEWTRWRISTNSGRRRRRRNGRTASGRYSRRRC